MQKEFAPPDLSTTMIYAHIFDEEVETGLQSFWTRMVTV